MPFLELLTNVALSREQSKDLALSLSKTAAEILQKPESLISVQVRADEILTFAGTHDPCFQLRITSLGNLTPENNICYSEAFTEFLKAKIGVENSRGYIVFYDPNYPNIGYKGTTAAKLWG
ncbi:uncharacterized protein BDCG_07681 [Blastomyces dermatitidis ER-3]|uniref:L-dopachrome isomerase n=3 Tax=Blastomyces TaxID=229219 RepID=A0A179UJ82_BLAGS|nr:uncharacterized protein BDBG_03359 [Blastomyces gilchristii SLH14081]XP_045278859.1 uncharacterized protein BDCG_07681 [Blastomyces dermatitidis ER-3]EGE86747.1 hypothetical protein BDDG_09697 [Blastomyces dermatitidis ATCC 18188]EQL30395.1 hypothetical protein BDFG_07085 [Blastomyces dermatitidis ATCC 26199]EEQ92561.1 hypothetical protein BDCG_07681 [Blastomyces dermatitidis ER-3]OAT07279.1 hypothetical protein BDBG_03359 [Blastomyces gilchristii SLH14081]